MPKKSLHDFASGCLEAAIDGGILPAGTVMIEGPIAQHFGISRVPVRQAIARLERKGKAYRFNGRGLVVGPPGTPPRRELLEKVLPSLILEERPPPLAWQTFGNELEAIIVHQAFFGAVRLSEAELARHFNVGRSVARDALQHLEPLGLIGKDSSQRWLVVPLDDQRIHELYQLRLQLEPHTLAEATPFIPRDLLSDMITRHEHALRHYTSLSAEDLYALELDLHVTCLGYCPNGTFVSVLRRTQCLLLLSRQVLGRRLEMPQSEPFLAEHLTVLRAMAAGDATAAREAMALHLSNSVAKVAARAAAMRNRYQPTPQPFFRS
ncbi:GntR family transcriptional regulator [Rhodobacter sp. 24-YEA-8]|uniref:GntR family transcriptional regulator n=1 Tax=Rhodobacter sp. 24-YEA-8 TaxID=1884310 RepID=UPI00089A1B13|nr:GntR family transcriptional regulator [Rhodobacter sp. 24-YEA-8]SED50393.1 transcriptional regulator, GntR family [Rhodobacter sp. 24-YEA-8]